MDTGRILSGGIRGVVVIFSTIAFLVTWQVMIIIEPCVALGKKS